jgi:transposase
MAATASGTVARTDGEPGTVWRTLDVNFPTNSPLGQGDSRTNKYIGYGISQYKGLKYPRTIGQYNSQYGGQEVKNDVTAIEQDRRLAQAREIASRREDIANLGENDWSVPSQSGFGRYRVVLSEGAWVCGCKDFEKRGLFCKHILAVLELSRPPSCVAPVPHKQYRQHVSYTRAQTEEMRLVDSLLRDLVSEVPDLPRTPSKGGRPALSLSDSLYCAILKVYSGLSGRRAVGVYSNVKDRALLKSVPNYMVASRALNRPEATLILHRLLTISAEPLVGLEDGGVIAPDSTGVQTTSFGAWREERHGEKRQKKWLKVHAMVGTKTHIVIRAIVSDKNSGDSPEFEPLLRGAVEDGFRPAAVVADKGYLSADNYALAGSLGIEPYIPFRAGTVSNEVNRIRGVRKPESWIKAYHLFQANRAQFDRNYHRRSNVESVFSALKRKLGENVRSRTPTAQVNEILCKLIAYNMTVVIHEMFENGIAPTFQARGEMSSLDSDVRTGG